MIIKLPITLLATVLSKMYFEVKIPHTRVRHENCCLFNYAIDFPHLMEPECSGLSSQELTAVPWHEKFLYFKEPF